MTEARGEPRTKALRSPAWTIGLFLPLLWALFAAAPTHGDETLAYVVRPGDTLIGISRTHFADPARWPELKRLNGVRNDRRLMPGTTLRIPLDWLRQQRTRLLVVDVEGEVTLDGRSLTRGERSLEGALIETGEQGSVALQLPDGTTVAVRPATRLRLERLRSYESIGSVDSVLAIEQGRVESRVERQRKPGARFQTRTRGAVAAVRGTHYRLAAVEETTQAEVLEGTLDVAGAAEPARAVQVGGGFGVRIDRDGRMQPPAPLLIEPDTTQLPPLQERVLVRFRLPPVPGAARYRAQIATDPSFRTLRQEALFEGPELRFADLPDGDYALRVRALDGNGLEGHDATHRFRLKARPEPPFPNEPRAGSKFRGQRIEFRWSAAAEAATYALQVARAESFEQLVVDLSAIAATSILPEALFSPGRYVWRVASIRPDGDRGPWSDPQHFDVFAPPADPDPPALDDDTLVFRWPAEPGQRFLFQMARDPQFTTLVHEARLDAATISLARPDAGIYYMRVQATDPDGFVGPFTATQRVVVPQPPPPPWLLLLPLLLLLL